MEINHVCQINVGKHITVIYNEWLPVKNLTRLEYRLGSTGFIFSLIEVNNTNAIL